MALPHSSDDEDDDAAAAASLDPSPCMEELMDETPHLKCPRDASDSSHDEPGAAQKGGDAMLAGSGQAVAFPRCPKCRSRIGEAGPMSQAHVTPASPLAFLPADTAGPPLTRASLRSPLHPQQGAP